MKPRNFHPAILLGLLVGLYLADTEGSVYYSKEEAFELAFGGGKVDIENLPVFLSDEQVNKIEALAKTRLESPLFTFHVGKKAGVVQGYAAIDSQVVRSQSETVLVVLDASGKLQRTEILAFHEPPEYKTPNRWLEKLLNHPLAELILNQGIDGVSGATLSGKATLNSVRKTLAVFQVGTREDNQP